MSNKSREKRNYTSVREFDIMLNNILIRLKGKCHWYKLEFSYIKKNTIHSVMKQTIFVMIISVKKIVDCLPSKNITQIKISTKCYSKNIDSFLPHFFSQKNDLLIFSQKKNCRKLFKNICYLQNQILILWSYFSSFFTTNRKYKSKKYICK